MKAFELVQPTTLEQALEALPGARDPKAGSVKLLAGGQDLLTELKDHLIEPDKLVNLKRVPGLDRLEYAGGTLDVGALVTIAQLESFDPSDASGRARLACLREAAASIASVQIRNVGTVGGNLCQRPRCWYYRHENAICIKKGGSECFSYSGMSKYNAILGGGPSYIVHPSDLAPALVALDAEAVIRSKKGERRVALEQFFTLPGEGSILRENVLAPDEVLTRVLVPPAPGAWKSTYVKFKERGSYDFALASVALALKVEGGLIADSRLVLGGVAPVPWRATNAEAALKGRKIDAETCALAGKVAMEFAEPLAHNGYKVPLTQGLITKALRALA